MARIVVGVDGSAPSEAALLWAADEARRRKAELSVVLTWENPNPDMWIPRIQGGPDQALKMTEAALDRFVGTVLGPRPGIEVHQIAAEGPPAKVLTARARDADLLVVGRRGRGGLSGMVLGSVSLYCVSHAPCPVVVVRGNATSAAPHSKRSPGPAAEVATGARSGPRG